LHQWIKKFSVFFYDVRRAVVLHFSAWRTVDGGERRTADLLQTIWNELDFPVDVCRITKGAYIERLSGMSQKLGVLFY